METMISLLTNYLILGAIIYGIFWLVDDETQYPVFNNYFKQCNQFPYPKRILVYVCTFNMYCIHMVFRVVSCVVGMFALLVYILGLFLVDKFYNEKSR